MAAGYRGGGADGVVVEDGRHLKVRDVWQTGRVHATGAYVFSFSRLETWTLISETQKLMELLVSASSACPGAAACGGGHSQSLCPGLGETKMDFLALESTCRGQDRRV